MIDLGRKPEKVSEAVPSPTPKLKQPEIYYPSFYVDKDLGLTEDDAGKVIIALVKLKIVEVGKRATEDNKKHTNNFDVLGIDLNVKRKGHYAKEK